MKKEKRTWLITILTLAAAIGLAQPAAGLANPRAADDEALAQTLAAPGDADGSRMAEPAEAEENKDASPGDASKEEATPEKEPAGGVDRSAMVVFGQDVELKAGETAQVVVVIGGSARIHGKVREAVVVIGGDAEIDGDVGQQVVAVMGSIRLRPGAVVHQDVVSVGGKLDIAEGATVKGQAQEVAIGGLRMPRADWINNWLKHCALMLRPLAPQVSWVWIVAFVYFLLFLLIAAVFRHPVQVCVDELEHRPATTFIIGLLTKLFLPLLILILVVIVIGIVVVPFLAAGLFVLSLVGKVAVLEWIGFKLGRLFGKEPVQQPVLALAIGSAVLALLYMIPVIGLLAMLLLSVWSLGCAMTAAFGGFRRELPERPTAAPAAIPAPVMSAAAPPAMPAMSLDPPPPPTPSNPPPAAVPAAIAPPVLPDTLAYPKASFWERMAAGFLDTVLLVILGAVVQGPPLALVVALAYFAG
ncbi:MAG TPA: polymer-forming cytoskeletal protein, partial [Verrucomicrobiae bacterium]